MGNYHSIKKPTVTERKFPSKYSLYNDITINFEEQYKFGQKYHVYYIFLNSYYRKWVKSDSCCCYSNNHVYNQRVGLEITT